MTSIGVLVAGGGFQGVSTSGMRCTEYALTSREIGIDKRNVPPKSAGMFLMPPSNKTDAASEQETSVLKTLYG
jgi:hypothetical protein